MITLKEFMEAVDYRINEGSDYGWPCFGPAAYSLSAWNGDHDGWSANVTFDTKDQTVYTVEVCDYKHNRAYRLINPDYEKAYRDYGKKEYAEYYNQAWDDVNFIDLEVGDDWIQKTLAIKEGRSYDTKITVPLDLTNEEMFNLMKMAHQRDITLNQLVEEVLWEVIRKEEKTTE